MVDRPDPTDETLVGESVVPARDLEREQAERLRWINSRIREANEADLIEEADIVPLDEDDLPVVEDGQ